MNLKKLLFDCHRLALFVPRQDFPFPDDRTVLMSDFMPTPCRHVYYLASHLADSKLVGCIYMFR